MTAGGQLQERRKRETREQIQRTARRLMAELGYEKVTMRALAEEAGVGLGTISLHFKDKKTLLLSVFHDEIGRESMRAFEAMSEQGPLKDKFLGVMARLYAFYAQNIIVLRPVVREALFATGEWKERFDAQLYEAVELVSGLVERHKALGEVRSDVSGRHAAMAAWSIYVHGLIDGLNSEIFDAEAQVAKVEPMLNVLFGGILVQGGGRDA